MTAGVGLKPLDVFTLGLRYLRNSQTDEAREAFRQAAERDPGMCDAWLGMLATGSTSPDVTAGAYRSVSNLGVALKTAGMTVADLSVFTSMYRKLTMCSKAPLTCKALTGGALRRACDSSTS